MPRIRRRRRAGVAAAIAATPFALAFRFALLYRTRAGFPRPRPPLVTPADIGLPFEEITVRAANAELPAWFVPARAGQPGPGVALVHGWESARDRLLPTAGFLHAAGFHVLLIDIRGHGANPPEHLPITCGEFGVDALAAFDALLARPEVTVGAIAGHSMGGIGAILAAAWDGRVRAVVSTSAPADPYRLTRLTFDLVRLPLPNVVAYPLAMLTTRVFLRPRGHSVSSISASAALQRYRGPVLLVHGDADDVVPLNHHRRLLRAARLGRRTDGAVPGTVGAAESLVVAGGRHSWLYEFPAYRRTVARFLAEALGGPLSPGEAADRAEAVDARRHEIWDPILNSAAFEPRGARALAAVVWPRLAAPPPSFPDEPPPLDA
jgi:alpha-beta hydrolase superfamily lysophospholipase